MATGALSAQRPSKMARATARATPILAALSTAQPQNNPNINPTTAPRKSTISRFRGATAPDLLTSPFPSSIPTTPTAPAPSWSWVGSSPDGSLALPTTTNVFYALHNHHNHQNTTSPAICVLGSGSGSGGTSGGLHSAALALGWLRGLHGLGVLHRAQLLAAGPGLCSWLAAAVCYATQQQEQEEQQHNGVEDAVGRLLGPMVPPEQCGMMGMRVGMGALGGLQRLGAGMGSSSSGGLEAMLVDAARLLAEYGADAEQGEGQHEEQEQQQGGPCSGFHTALQQRMDTIIALVPSQ